MYVCMYICIYILYIYIYMYIYMYIYIYIHIYMQSIRHEKYGNSTELSKYVWQLKKEGEEFKITWSINRRAQAYSNTTKRCNLCLTEKLSIINADKTTTLNKRTELVSKCRHQNKYYLAHF